MSTTSTSTVVQYAGERAATARLTWGQRAIGIALAGVAEAGRPAALNIRRVVEIPSGRALNDVLESLSELFGRHEVLRSTFRTGDGELRQTVHRSGTVDVGLFPTDPTAASHRATELADELAAAPFPPDRLHPVRCAIVLEDGAPTYLALAVNHQAVDAVGIRLLLEELTRLLTDGPPFGSSRRPGPQPVEVAEAEQGRLAGTSDAAIASWREALDAAPRSIFDYPPRPPSGDRYTRLDIRSPAVAWAAGVLAGRCNVTTSTVLLTAHALVLSAYTGHVRVPMRLVSANRQHTHLRDLVAPTSQGATLDVDLAGTSFEQAVRRVLVGSLRTYARAYYDTDALSRLLLDLRREQGRFHDLRAIHNDARGMDQSWPGAPTGQLSPGAVEAMLERTTIDEERPYTHHRLKWFQEIVTDPDAFVASLHLDQAYVPVDVGVTLLRGIESLLVRAVTGEVKAVDVPGIVGIEPVVRPASWARVGQDWVDTVAVRDHVATVAGTQQVAVAVDPPAGLCAYLGPDARVSSPAELHVAVCERITADTPHLLSPTRYVFCAGSPTGGDDVTAWRTAPVREEGDGRG